MKPWHRLAAALVTVACLLLFRGLARDSAGVPRSSSASSEHYARSLGPANIPLPPGRWEATGTIVWVAPNVMTNQPPGTVLRRPWNFHSVCRGTCKLVFSRWTLYGPSVTPLVKHGRFFIAQFPPVEVPCAYPRGSSYPRHPFGQSHDRYKLWWSSDRTEIYAIERRIQTGCYRTPDPDVTRWHAIRATPASLAERNSS